MKLHCFFNLHPLVLVLYYFFFTLLVFHFKSLYLIFIIFLAVVLLNYFCGCLKKTIDFIKYFFAFGILIFISNLIFVQPFDICAIRNFFSFCISVILFLSFNKLIDSGKFIYLFSKLSPNLALILNICMRYVSLMENRIREFIDIHLLNNEIKNKLEFVILVLTKIFDWAISDCLTMSQVLKMKNYNGTVNFYKVYKFNLRDVIFLLGIFFFGVCIFVLDEHFLFCYLLLPYIGDFFCWLKFCIRRKF